MSGRRSLFFVAIVPPEPIRTEVRAFQKIASELFESKRALRSPVHITLVPPFRISENLFMDCEEVLRDIARRTASFSLSLNGFDTFKPRVIYMEVHATASLNLLQSTLEKHICELYGLSHQDRPYRPHMTIAFKDLRKKMFYAAWDYYSEIEYTCSFEVQQIALLRHDEVGWTMWRTFQFGV